MKILKLAAIGAVLGLSLIVSAPANAGTYVFSFSDPTDSGSGKFVTTGNTVTGISGSVDGSAITGLSSYADSDQVLYAAAPYVDFSGISFSTIAGSFNLFSNPGAWLLKSTVDPVGYPQNGTPITLSVSAVPEPTTWSLMLLAIGGLGLAMRTSKRKPATAFSVA